MKSPAGVVRFSIAMILAGGFCAAALAERVTYARHLALSPDGGRVAFSWAGDIWTVGHEGGRATRLTVHPATDTAPVWSHDGQRIAFASSRHGAACIYVMNADGTGVTRLTYSDRTEVPSNFTPDNQAIYFHSRQTGEVAWLPRVYAVPVAGGQPYRVMEAGGSDASLSPDARHIVFTRGASRWWRTDYRGSANWDLWLHDLRSGAFRQLTTFDGTDIDPVWNATGTGVYFLSDRAGQHNVWYQPLTGNARQVTAASGHRIRDFTISANESRLIYTQWDKVFHVEQPSGRSREITIEAGGDAQSNRVELKTMTNGAAEQAFAPDGKQVAFVVRGEIFVRSTDDDRPTRRITDSPARDWQITWSPDGKALYFVSDREGREDIYRATSAEDPPKDLGESLRFRIERVTASGRTDARPDLSPDGKHLSFVRGRGHLVVRDLESGEERTLLEGWNDLSWQWSPDSKWIAYEVEDAEYNPDVWIVPSDGSGPAVNISQHPDTDVNPQWSADGQVLAFSSQRRGMDTDLYMVFLSPELHEKSQAEKVRYFEKAGEAAKKRKPPKETIASGPIMLASGQASPVGAKEDPDEDEAGKKSEDADEQAADDEADETTEDKLRALLKEFLAEEKSAERARKDGKKEDDDKDEDEDEDEKEAYAYDLETAFERVTRVTSLPASQSSFALSPAGDVLVFVSRHEGSTAVFSVQWDGSKRKKIISSAVSGLRWGLDGKRLYYLKSGVPGSSTASGGDSKTYGFRAKMAIDHRAEAEQKFNDAARRMGLWFYHPTLKGLDWQALTDEYRALALSTRTMDEFNEIFNLLLGRLNGSHLGISSPSGGQASESIGYLGVDLDPAHSGPGLKIAAITPRGPADRDESRLSVGDVIIRIDQELVGNRAPLNRALVDRVGDEVVLEYVPAAKAAEAADGDLETEELVIRPISYGAYSMLQYEAWVAANRDYVERQSGGRLAYAHIRGMGEPQFHTFERDLYAVAHGKEGLIVDVRNNGGGWTADWVMAVLNVRRHAYTIGRGGERGYPQGRLIFYAWTAPATMMCNQFSYSNAEIVSHAFKNLGRGPLVGTTTFGAVISTGAYGLIDGGRIRQPFRGWYTLPDGLDMENNGAEPTVPVSRGPADEQAGRYPQLDAAIKATLDQLGGGAAGRVRP